MTINLSHETETSETQIFQLPIIQNHRNNFCFCIFCSIYWDYALQVQLDEVVYVHCHQDSEAGGTIILVGQDGVQRPPIHFPKGQNPHLALPPITSFLRLGGHMLTFLSCLETGLLPRGRLDPPLWSQRCGTNSNTKRRRPLPALSETEEVTKDYVFRIIDNSDHKDIRESPRGF